MPPGVWPDSLSLDALELEPKIDWAESLRRSWTPGEASARRRLRSFLDQGLSGYASGRDYPDRDGTSALSPHLHFGEISVRTLWAAIHDRAARLPKSPHREEAIRVFASELGWREFAHHLLYHFPETPEEPLRGAFSAFPWQPDRRAFRAWRKGQTGFPIVDAGLRQLWATGWMHNRVRMITASFLVKDLLISWQEGAAWFWDTLVDADLANNTLGWQWTAGCGADAAPYFRVFNPVRQGETFDPEGDYVRRWVPELAGLPAAWVHRPWQAPADVLEAAGVSLGTSYPRPIVDHDAARLRALEAFQQVKVST